MRVKTKVSSQESRLYEKIYGALPIGAAVVDSVGVVVWLNTLASQFFDDVKIGQILLSTHDWPRFRKILEDNEPFYYSLFEQGYIVTPHKLPRKQSRTLLWLVPSNSMELNLVAMQQDLIHQRQLANLGKLMLEMAHEFNNPLAGISMGVQLIDLTLEKAQRDLHLLENPPSSLLGDLEKIKNEIHRIQFSTNQAAALRNELLSYSKPNVLNLKPYNMRDLLQTIVDHVKQQPIFQAMNFHLSFSEVSADVVCDLSKLEQILYNLVKNAHDATEGGGTIWIREFVQGPHVRLEFEDDGPGIPQELISKIFSPFLTTKPRTGSGLGLSISQQIIHQHGGTITAYNKPDSGACFQITLPISHES